MADVPLSLGSWTISGLSYCDSQLSVCLQTLSQLNGNGSWSSQYNLSKDHTKNAASNNSSTVACMSLVTIMWRLLSHCPAMGVLTEPFPSNGCLCWFQNSGFQQTRHITLSLRLLTLSSLSVCNHSSHLRGQNIQEWPVLLQLWHASH
jgi:hypothetical protein